MKGTVPLLRALVLGSICRWSVPLPTHCRVLWVCPPPCRPPWRRASLLRGEAAGARARGRTSLLEACGIGPQGPVVASCDPRGQRGRWRRRWRWRPPKLKMDGRPPLGYLVSHRRYYCRASQARKGAKVQQSANAGKGRNGGRPRGCVLSLTKGKRRRRKKRQLEERQRVAAWQADAPRIIVIVAVC